MKKYVNGEYLEMTPEEKEQMLNDNNSSYDEVVNSKIRERYTESQEFAILRQKDEKPEEYAEYYAYCEECKEYVRKHIEQFTKAE